MSYLREKNVAAPVLKTKIAAVGDPLRWLTRGLGPRGTFLFFYEACDIGQEKCIQNSGSKTWRDHWEDHGVDGVNLKLTLQFFSTWATGDFPRTRLNFDTNSDDDDNNNNNNYYYYYLWGWEPFLIIRQMRCYLKTSQYFMEPDVSLPCS
jgi:hypothetical protein